MADNVTADPGAGGATLAADDIGGVHYPRTKIVIGADGSADGDVSGANPMPISAATMEGLLTTIDADTGTLAATVSAGAVQIIGSLSTVTTVSTLTGGGVAHDSPDSGNPVKVGGKAQTSLKTATLVANADRTDAIHDLDGAQVMKVLCPFGDIIVERKVDSAGTSSNFATFNGSSGVRNYITSITLANSNASLDGTVDLRDGSAGSAFWTIPAPHAGGAHLTFNPPLRQPTAATALAMDASAAIPDITVSVCGFQSKA